MVIVVAHPDDETLWLSSVLASAAKVVFCFGAPYQRPQMAASKRRAVAALRMPNLIDLAIPESGVKHAVDWQHPEPTTTGLTITEDAARVRYEENYALLLERLEGLLAGAQHVCTHNPWGEYGHAEHVQVHRAVATLQSELGFTLWIPNYISKKSWPLAKLIAPDLYWFERRTLQTDIALARKNKAVYLKHGAWTWNRRHHWPPEETLYALQPSDSVQKGQSIEGEWLLDVAKLRWGSPPWRPARRRIR